MTHSVTMVKVSFIVALIEFGLAVEQPWIYEFTKNTCHFIYGDPIGQSETVTDMQCVKACMKHENCTSLMYEKTTRQCFLNAEIMEDWSQFPEDCGVQYAAPVTRYFGCEDGWQFVAGRCFLYPDVLLSWFGCDDYCIGENGYLAKYYNTTDLGVLSTAYFYDWDTTNIADGWYPWMTVNDLSVEGVFTDRDNVPLNPAVLSTIYYNGEPWDCGYSYTTKIEMDGCEYAYSCLCEQDPKVITKRAKRFK